VKRFRILPIFALAFASLGITKAAIPAGGETNAIPAGGETNAIPAGGETNIA